MKLSSIVDTSIGHAWSRNTWAVSGCRYDSYGSYDTLDGDTMTWSRRDVVPGATLVQGGAVAGAENGH